MNVDSQSQNFGAASALVVKALFLLSIISASMLFGCKENNAAIKEEVARFNRSAIAYQEQGQYRAAMLEAKNAIQKDPKDPQGYITLAKIYNQVGSYAGTQKVLESVVKDVPAVSIELADAYVQGKKYRSALNLLTNYDEGKATPEVVARKQAILARAAIHLGEKAAYEAAVGKLATMPDQQNETNFIEAEYLISQGHTEEAQAKLDALSVSDVKNVRVLILLGNFSLRQNQLAKAEDYYTKALSLLPNTDVMTIDKTVALSQLTETLIQQGKTAEAYRYQKILAEANPESQAAQQKFNEAMEYYRQGKFTEAKKILDEIREQYPQDKNTAVLLGLVQYQQGQDKQALELFDKFIDPETASPTIIQAAVLAKYRNNKMNEAVKLLKESVDSQPDNAEIQATYGLALLDLDPTSANGERAIEKSLALNPKQQRLRLALAKRAIAMSNKAQAIAQLKKGYGEDRQDLFMQQAYFKALLGDGRLEEVKTEISNFQKDYPNSARGVFLEGWYKITQNDYVGAQAAFERALAVKGNTEKTLSYAGLAQLFEIQKQPQKAVNAWQSLLQEDPAQIPAYTSWLKQMQELKRIKEANAFLIDLEKKTDKWEPSVVLAQFLALQGEFSQAVAHINVALERSANTNNVKQVAADLYLKYGLSLKKAEKVSDARIYMLKALNFFPSNMNILANVIELEIAQKNIPEAQKLLDQFSSTEEFAAEHAYLQGIIRQAEGKQDEAVKLFLESWKKKPLDVVAETVFDYYNKNNQAAEADKFVEDWVVKLPNNPRPALIKAVKAQEAKDMDSAVKWYEKTIQLAPNMPAAVNNLAWIYYEQKNPKAIDLAKRAYEMAGSNPAIMDTYGWILVENNRIQEGLEILERAVSLAPTNAEIKEHLATAKARAK
jgi:tetratricopeptide (TPR) repeat protein